MEFTLIKEVLKKSVSKDWQEAKKEWDIDRIEYDKDGDVCTCGHKPIKELCYMYNLHNKDIILVGNCCKKKFFELNELDPIFRTMKTKKINKETIILAYLEKITNEKEHEFLLQVFRKRKRSEKQEKWLKALTAKIIRYFNDGKKESFI